MKKVIKLTESDLERIVRRVIKEQSGEKPSMSCKQCIKDAFGSSYSKNADAMITLLDKFELSKSASDVNITPDDYEKALSGIDIFAAFRIGPSIMECLINEYGKDSEILDIFNM